MTEEEMKTKYCPYNGIEKSIRIHAISMAGIENPKHKSVVSSLKELVSNKDQKCIASECAMWTWKMHPKDAAFLNKIGDNKQEPQGYCGLTRGE